MVHGRKRIRVGLSIYPTMNLTCDGFLTMVIYSLGDRHGENILLDETNGDTAHVDFNCLFDKGLTFDKPEMVPFRLTNNMVDGFGVTGYEGMFSLMFHNSQS